MRLRASGAHLSRTCTCLTESSLFSSSSPAFFRLFFWLLKLPTHGSSSSPLLLFCSPLCVMQGVHVHAFVRVCVCNGVTECCRTPSSGPPPVASASFSFLCCVCLSVYALVCVCASVPVFRCVPLYALFFSQPTRAPAALSLLPFRPSPLWTSFLFFFL